MAFKPTETFTQEPTKTQEIPTKTSTPTLVPTPTLTITPSQTTDPRANCDPCYPDVCIPKILYDLDCKDVSYRRFRCVCDPHGFDGDNDGIGCESG